ncbi:hypothetical protein ACHIPZ_13850 [Antrihabitans sp. NCIMB 15449]|uniref:DUF3168 domain-containing protein n=1 Tax=Antrihabitans spumae TaxID=3373370 RepID=A0ABW7JMP1_9NOCA
MKPFRVPGDPARAAKDHFTSVLPGLVSGTDPTVGLTVPSGWDKETSPAHVGVFDDGGPSVWPITTTPRLRVTVWSNSRTRSREIAGLCVGVLLAHRIPGIAAVTDPSSILDARDPDNGGHMASITVDAVARTLAV